MLCIYVSYRVISESRTSLCVCLQKEKDENEEELEEEEEIEEEEEEEVSLKYYSSSSVLVGLLSFCSIVASRNALESLLVISSGRCRCTVNVVCGV